MAAFARPCCRALLAVACLAAAASAQSVSRTGNDGRPAPSTDATRAPSGRDSAAVDSLSAVARNAAARAKSFVPDKRWLPRVFTIGVGGVASSPPGSGTSYSPVLGGAFAASAIGYLTPHTAWRVEGFLHLHDRAIASEPALLADEPERTCSGGVCHDELRETSRRTSGGSVGVEYHPMRGHVGVYGVAMLGLARSSSLGDAGDRLGFAPSVGLGVLAPMSAGIDGFAMEARWRRIPTALGVVNAAVLSLELRF